MKHAKTTTIARVGLIVSSVMMAQSLWAAFVLNPSFESNLTADAAGAPEGWSIVGAWGVNQVGAALYNTGTLIADRDRYAFVWHEGTLSQEITGLTPGKQYWLQFWFEGRNCCGGTMTLQVSFGGAPIGAISGIENVTSGFEFANLAFTPTNNAGTLAFTTTVGGDASLFLDAVSIVQRDAGSVVLMNPSFEASGPPTALTGNPPAADSGEIIKPALMAGWTWDTNQSGTYGVSLVGGTYADNGAIPDQDLVGFISGPGSLSQTVANLVVNTPYQLSFAYNAQSAAAAHAHLQVMVGGAVIHDQDVAPVGGSNPYHTNTLAFTPTNSTAVISFAQTSANGTLLLDDVQLVGQVQAQAPVTFSPTSLLLASNQTVQIQVTVPPAFLMSSAADVSVSSSSPTVFQVVNADTNGVLTLHFAQGATNVQTFQVVGVGNRSASLQASASSGLQAQTLPTVQVFTSFILNPSFEYSFPGVTPIPGWTGAAAVETSSGHNMDNGIIPDQSQVAVLAGSNTLSQQIYNLTPGRNHWLQFRYNASYGASQAGANGINLKVKLGGAVLAAISNIMPAGLSVGDVPFNFTNINFVPTNTSELLEFDTTTTPGTSPTLLLDAVSMVQRDTNEVVIENPSFEASGEPYVGHGTAGPAMAGWTLGGDGYILQFYPGDTGGADNGVTPDQSEVLLLWHDCTVSNLISGLAVSQPYTLSYGVNQRICCGGSSTYSVVFGDIPLLYLQPVTPVGGNNPYLTQYLTFTNDAPSNVLVIAAFHYDDASIMLDDFRLVPGLRVPPQVLSQSPAPGESSSSQPPIDFVLAQGSYPFNTNALQLLLNGSNVTARATVTTTTNGMEVAYAYPTLPPGTNAVDLIVSDENTPPFTIALTNSFVILPPPAVAISLSAGHVALSWPASATGYVLQQSGVLGTGASWSSVTGGTSSPVVITIPATGTQFYRLIKQ